MEKHEQKIYQPTTLATQAAKKAARSLQSPDARFLLSHHPLDPLPALAAEAAHLPARGRIMGEKSHIYGASTLIQNGPGNKVDGARLFQYDAHRRVVTVRVDHSTIPEFWLELDLPLAQLEAWLGREVAEGERAGADEDDEDEEEEDSMDTV